MKLSRISLAFLPLLSLCSVQAAVYNVVEVGEVPELKSTYASAINDAGDSVFNGAIYVLNSSNNSVYQYFDFPLQLDLVDFENESIQALFTDEQLADLNNGITDATTLGILLATNPARQPIGSSLGFVKNGTESAYNYVLRDNAKTRMNSEYLNDIANSGMAVGMATALQARQSFTPEPTATTPEPVASDVWVPLLPAFSGIAKVNNLSLMLSPPYQLYGGGYSSAEGVSNTGLIAGYGSVGMSEAAITEIESRCTGAAVPVDLCLFTFQTSRLPSTAIKVPNSDVSFGYIQRGLVWQVNGDVVTSVRQLGILGDKNSQQSHTREGYTELNYYSKAFAVNDKGIAVGLSLYSDSDRVIRPDEIYRTEHAALFVEDDALPMVDPAEWERSRAIAINNNDIVVGTAGKVINSFLRNKMFLYDYNTDTTRYVRGFFESSDTIANAINDNNQIVGRAETLVASTTARRIHGFLYDIGTDKFTDLNTLLACNTPYTIVDAQDINNNGVITATALVEREKRDLKGEVVLDSIGIPETEFVTTVVTMQPIANGEVEDCNASKIEYERKGGSSGFGIVLLSTALLWWRRRQR